MEIPGADISASVSVDRSLVWNFHMSWTATNVSDRLLQLALYKHRSRRSIIHQLLSAYSTVDSGPGRKGYGRVKRKVFRWRLKLSNDGECLIGRGISFHIWGEAEEKARRPNS